MKKLTWPSKVSKTRCSKRMFIKFENLEKNFKKFRTKTTHDLIENNQKAILEKLDEINSKYNTLSEMIEKINQKGVEGPFITYFILTHGGIYKYVKFTSIIPPWVNPKNIDFYKG